MDIVPVYVLGPEEQNQALGCGCSILVMLLIAALFGMGKDAVEAHEKRKAADEWAQAEHVRSLASPYGYCTERLLSAQKDYSSYGDEYLIRPPAQVGANGGRVVVIHSGIRGDRGFIDSTSYTWTWGIAECTEDPIPSATPIPIREPYPYGSATDGFGQEIRPLITGTYASDGERRIMSLHHKPDSTVEFVFKFRSRTGEAVTVQGSGRLETAESWPTRVMNYRSDSCSFWAGFDLNGTVVVSNLVEAPSSCNVSGTYKRFDGIWSPEPAY